MSEQQELRKRSHTWTWVAVVVAILVLYVLSIGPAYVLALRDTGDPFGPGPQWYSNIYGPLEALAKAAHCRRWLGNYQQWWIYTIR